MCNACLLCYAQRYFAVSDDCGCGTQNEKSVDMFLCASARKRESVSESVGVYAWSALSLPVKTGKSKNR